MRDTHLPSNGGIDWGAAHPRCTPEPLGRWTTIRANGGPREQHEASGESVAVRLGGLRGRDRGDPGQLLALERRTERRRRRDPRHVVVEPSSEIAGPSRRRRRPCSRRPPRPPRRRPSCRSAKRSHSKTPIGPFQKTVFAPRISAPNRSRVSGPMSRPSQSSGRSSYGATRLSALSSNAAAATTSRRQLDRERQRRARRGAPPPSCRRRSRCPRGPRGLRARRACPRPSRRPRRARTGARRRRAAGRGARARRGGAARRRREQVRDRLGRGVGAVRRPNASFT